MDYQNVFRRREIKYRITASQQERLLLAMKREMVADSHGASTICNIYFDTPSYLFIRRSLEKPVYKEKIRMRCYGNAEAGTPVYIEIKKKYLSVVYKRRIDSTEAEAMSFLCEKTPLPRQTQISREFSYLLSQHPDLMPAMFISYERQAYFGQEDANFRITFDRNILYREDDLCLHHGAYGTPILRPEEVLMEVKSTGGMPLWFVRLLTENQIFPTSFSKYGTAYQMQMTENGGILYA